MATCTWKGCKLAAREGSISQLCDGHQAQEMENLERFGKRMAKVRRIADRYVGSDNVKHRACVDDIIELIESELDDAFERDAK